MNTQISREIFHDNLPEGSKVEYIDGHIVFSEPHQWMHIKTCDNLALLLSVYVNVHNLGYVGIEKIMISLTRNDYEPDVCYFNKSKADQFKPDQMRFPAPDFVVEVLSESTAVNDRGVKFEDYAAHGVTEYWIIDPGEETIEQYILRSDAYELMVKVKTGQIDSIAIPGFSIPVRAVFDEQENGRALPQLLQ
jgi:Uma2 family endonuclease